MDKSKCFVYLMLSFLLIENVIVKTIVLLGLLWMVFKKKITKIGKNALFSCIVYCLLLVTINYLVEYSLESINFAYLVVFNLLCGYSKMKVKEETFVSFYFVLVVIGGALNLCLMF